MDKIALIEDLVRCAHEKGGFSGAWLYAENGEIVSKGAIGVNDLETGAPITEGGSCQAQNPRMPCLTCAWRCVKYYIIISGWIASGKGDVFVYVF